MSSSTARRVVAAAVLGLGVALATLGLSLPAYGYEATSLWPWAISETSTETTSGVASLSDPIGAGFEGEVQQYAYPVASSALGSLGGFGAWTLTVTPPTGRPWAGWAIFEKRATVSCVEGYDHANAYQASSTAYFSRSPNASLTPVNTWAQGFTFGNIPGSRSWGNSTVVIVRVAYLYYYDGQTLKTRMQGAHKGAAEFSCDYSTDTSPTPSSLSLNSGSTLVKLWNAAGTLAQDPDEQTVLAFYGGGVTDDPVAVETMARVIGSPAGVSTWALTGIPSDPDGVPDADLFRPEDTPADADGFAARIQDWFNSFKAPIDGLLWFFHLLDEDVS